MFQLVCMECIIIIYDVFICVMLCVTLSARSSPTPRLSAGHSGHSGVFPHFLMVRYMRVSLTNNLMLEVIWLGILLM